jgi:hypothetical protein
MLKKPPQASEPSLLNKSSCLAAALGVTQFKTIIAMYFTHFVVLLKFDLDVQQTHLRPLSLVCRTKARAYLKL